MRLGAVPPRELGGARAQAHWAVQVISAAGETFAEHAADTSHTATSWNPGRGALVGVALGGDAALRVGLRMPDLTLVVSGRDDSVRAELPLDGRTLAEANAWASRELAVASGGALDAPLVHPGYELEPHPIGAGGAFRADPGLRELARWYAVAAAELTRLRSETSGAGPVLCWPHHFDIAMRIELERDAEGAATRTVGVGLSPGDDFVPEPYWYVNPWPTLEGAALPPLRAGEWFTDGFVGAVERSSAIVDAGDGRAQSARLRAFLDAALPASIALARAAPLE